MLKTYCPTCGAPNEYASAKPNFCGRCGKSLTSFAPTTYASLQRKPVDSDSEEREYYHLDPERDDFTFEAEEIKEARPIITFGELAKQKKTGYQRLDNMQNVSKNFLKDFQAQAGNNGKTIEVDENN